MKFWKNWPYWLRGGVIGLIIIFLNLLLVYSCEYYTSGYSSLGCGLIFIIFGPIYPFALFASYAQSFLGIDLSEGVDLFVGAIIFLFVCILIGIVSGRIKKARTRRAF